MIENFSNVENLAFFCLTDCSFVRSFEDFILTFNLLLEFCIEIYNIESYRVFTLLELFISFLVLFSLLIVGDNGWDGH